MMSGWRDRLKLAEGETINLLQSKSSGFMQETDVETYEIRASNGSVSGTVIFTDHTAFKGFKRTLRVVQRSAAGEILIDEAWTA